MSIYSNVTDKDLDNLRKLSEQQKNQRALKIKNKILKQTHDVKIAESLSPITKKLNEVGDIIKESNSKIDLKALPNSSQYSKSMQEMLGSLMSSHNSLKIIQNESKTASILGVPIQISGPDTIKIKENIYELTPEVYKALSNPIYTGKTMKIDDDFSMLYNILKDIKYTGIKDRPSNRKTFFTINLPKRVSEINNKRYIENTDDSHIDLQSEGIKRIIIYHLI